ncbi:glucose-dependent insulinotropic receptor [Megalops cyprinoides]|uniref:glucose-dependent insulinotropic receptor n=1 Tax=Megalops cyprinoides TaxID=118141 RepID=UPI00186527ED|nr:glucose-dependent insulinotropic receptor [Megalops cyprinoides]
MAVDNGTCLVDSQPANTQAPTQGGPLQTTVVHRGMDAEVLGWILSVGSMLIIATNLLVAAALLLLIRKKGSQSWCFVLNLALADALVGLAITGIASVVINADTSPTNKTRCLLRMAFVTSTSAASILTMFLISLDRYVAIKLPLRYSQLTGPRMTAVALAVLWLLSFTVGFLPGMVQQMQQNHYQGFCTFFSVIQPKSIIIIFCICFFPVLSIFVYFYLDILKIACGHQHQICQARLAGSRVPQPNRYGGHVKALRTVALLVGCFTLSWCPFFIASTVQVLCQSCHLYHIIENDLWLLGLSNSLFNPLVYACWQREVRQELCNLFACMKSRFSNSAPRASLRGRHTEHTVHTDNPEQGYCRSASLPQLIGGAHHTNTPLTASASL